MATVKFGTVVSRIKSDIKRKARTRKTISALDVANVMRNCKLGNGTSRGAAVRRAFADLVEEKFLTATRQTVYNPDTHHSVTVYRVR